MTTLFARMLRAALLDPRTYEEIEADRAATPQAFAVVALASIAAGLGSLENNGWSGVGFVIAAALVGWLVWAWLALFIGTRVLPGAETRADLGELLRTIGFASAPGILLVLALLAPIAGWVYPICGIWMLVAMVVAVRQALDYEGPGGTLRAIAVCAIGFPAYVLLLATALLVFGPWPG
jgi:hypothetical protein